MMREVSQMMLIATSEVRHAAVGCGLEVILKVSDRTCKVISLVASQFGHGYDEIVDLGGAPFVRSLQRELTDEEGIDQTGNDSARDRNSAI